MSANLGTAVGYLDLNANGFNSALKQAQMTANSTAGNIGTSVSNKFNAVGKSMTSAGKKLTLGLTTTIATVGAYAFNLSSKFETALAKVKTIADTTQVSMGQFKTQITAMSNETGRSVTEISESLYQAISAGQQTKDALGFVKKASALAKGGFTDLTTSVDLLTTILNAYKMKSSETSHVSDTLIQTQNYGKTTVKELAETMGKAIPTAKAYNVSIEDLSTQYGILTRNGIKTRISTTYINGMLNELGKSGSNVASILKQKTGKSFAELTKSGYSTRDVLKILQDYCKKSGTAFTDLWSNTNAGKAALVLSGMSVKEYNKVLDQMSNSTGSANKAAKTMAATTETKFKKALNSGKIALMEFGDTLKTMAIPAINTLVSFMKKLSDKILAMSDKQRELIVKFGLFVAAIGPVLLITGKLITSIIKLRSMFMLLGSGLTNLIVNIGLAGGGLRGFLSILESTAIGGAITNLLTSIDLLGGGFKGLKLAISSTIMNSSLVTGITTAFNSIKTAAIGLKTVIAEQGIASAFSNLALNAEMAIPALGAISPVVLGIAAAVVVLIAAFKTLWDKSESFRNAITSAFKQVKDSFKDLNDSIVNTLQSLGINVSSVTDLIKKTWGAFCNYIAQPILIASFQTVANVISGAAQTIEGIFEILKGVITLDLDDIKKGFSDFTAGIGTFFLAPFEGIVKGITTTFGNLGPAIVEKLSGVWTSITNAFSNLRSSIGSTVSNVINTIVNFFVQLPGKVAGALSQLPYKIGYALGFAVTTVVKWGASLIVAGVTAAKNFIVKVVSGIASLPNKIATTLSNALKKAVAWAKEFPSKAKTGATNFVKAVANGIANLPSVLWNGLKASISKLSSWVSQMGKKGKAGIKKLISAVKSGASNIPSQMAAIGKNIVQGVWNGIKGAASSFMSNVKSFFKGIVDGAKSALGIHSPSKVFDKEVGQQIALGVVKGIKKKTAYAKLSASKFATVILNTAETKLSNLQRYNDISLQYEINYWTKIRKNLKKGTAAYKEATLKIKEAKYQLNKQIKQLDDDYTKNVQDVKDQLVENIQDVEKEYDDAVKSQAQSLMSSMALFDKFSSSTVLSSQNLIDNLQSQVDGMNEWDDVMDSLAAKGAPEELLNELEDLGPSYLAQVKLLANMTGDQWDQYVSLWQQKYSAATDRAVDEIDISEYTQKIQDLIDQANEDINSLTTDYVAALKELGVTVTDISYDIGTDTVDNIKKGIKSSQPKLIKAVNSLMDNVSVALESAIKDVGDKAAAQMAKAMAKVTAAAKTTLKIKSPSKVFAGIGNNIMLGLSNGIADKTSQAVLAAEDSMRTLIDHVNTLTQESGLMTGTDDYYIGSNFSNSKQMTGISTNQNANTNTGSGDTFIFNSPEPISEVEAARQLKKTKKELAEGF